MRELLDPPIQTLRCAASGDLGRAAWITVAGFALYGFTVGFWRSPVMGFYVAVKMPLLIACTLGCNGVLNGMLGLLLGSDLGFRQSLQALLGAFAISALVLGSIAPVTFFLALNAPPPDSPQAGAAHAGYLLSHTALVAIAGCIGVLRLRSLLEKHCATRRIARVTLAAWIAGNGFIGAQFSWILRPFFGTPSLEVAFLREHPMRGSFYEAVWRSLVRLLSDVDPALPPFLALFFSIGALVVWGHLRFNRNRTTA